VRVAIELHVEVKRERQTKKEMDRQIDTLAGVNKEEVGDRGQQRYKTRVADPI